MKHRIGNIVEEVNSGIILQQVNCQGVMGSGVALDIKRKWPDVEDEYLSFCRSKRHSKNLLGNCLLVKVEAHPELYVANLFSQEYYGRDGKRYTSYDALDLALFDLAIQLSDLKLFEPNFIHHPLIGCGLGGGSWKIVSAIIEANLGTDTTLWTLNSVQG